MIFFRKKIFFIFLFTSIGFFLFVYSKPVFAQDPTQNYFRWYVNVDSENVTDPWGNPDLGELEAIGLANSPPAPGTVLRIRMSLNASGGLPINLLTQFKLQWGENTGGACSGISSWNDMTAPASCITEAWCGFDNSTPADGDALSILKLSVSDVLETYEEQNNALTLNKVNPTQDGEWDWAIINNAATPNTSYCFQMVPVLGGTMTYNYYPELITQAITVAGAAYSDEGSSPLGGRTVIIKVNGANKCNGTSVCTAETNLINGKYAITNLDIDAANDVLTVFLDGETEKAVTVTKANNTTSDIGGLDLYQNRLIVRHESASAVTNTDLGRYDKDNDTDIHFTSNAGALVVDNDHELHIWTGKTFSPGGAVTTSAADCSLYYAASVHIDDNATFTAGGAISVGSIWAADTGTTFTHNNNTVTFTATGIGCTIATNFQAFYDLTFNGSGGGWSFSDTGTISNDLTVTAGTLSGTQSINVNGGDIICDGTCGVINLTKGAVTLTGTGNFGTNGLASNWTFYDLTFFGVTTAQGTGTITISDVLAIFPGRSLDAGSKTWTLSGTTGTPFALAGTFTANASTFSYTGNNGLGDTTVTATTYNSLTVNNVLETYVLAGTTNLNGDLNITNGILDVTATNHALNVKGSWTNAGTFTARAGTVTFNGTASGKTINPGSSSFYILTFSGSGGVWTLSTNNLDIDNDLNITTGTLSASTLNINLSGNLAIGANGVFIKGSGTFQFDGSVAKTWTDSTSSIQDLGTVLIDGTTKTINLGSSVKATKLTIGADDGLNLGAGGYTLTLTGSGTGASKPLTITSGGTLTIGNSTVEYTGGAATDVTKSASWNYYNLKLNGTGPFTAEAGAWTIDNNLNVTSGTFNLGGVTKVTNDVTISSGGTLDVVLGSNYALTVTGSWTNSGGVFNARAGLVTFNSSGSETVTTNSQAFYQLTFNNATGSWAMQDALDVNNTFNLTNGSLSQAANSNINFGGYVTFVLSTAFTKASGSGLVIFDGTGAMFTDQTASKQNLGNVHVGGSPDDITLCGDAVMDSLTVNSGDIFYLNTYSIDVTNSIIVASTGTLDASNTSSSVCPFAGTGSNINLESNWTVASDGSFLAGIRPSTVTFDGPASKASIIDSGGDGVLHAFNNLTMAKTPLVGAVLSYLANNIGVTGNFNISTPDSNLAAMTYNIRVGGNWSNAGAFDAGTGTVTFDAGSTGKTIDSGGTGATKDFYNIVFNNSSGGWTIQTNNLTATNNFSITDTAAASGFIVEANRTITVNGNFTNGEGGTTTTWNAGTVLNLTKTGGGSYTINTKTTGGDVYVTLQVGANTDIRMWNSSASTYTVNASGSLYSMDHAATDGELDIWGDYHTTSGNTDYWNYVEDFDGTAAANRQVIVIISASTSVTVDSGGILYVQGGGGISTDITNVGQGASVLWNFNCTGTCNVQESTWNYLNLTGGTLTVYNTTLNNEDAPDSGTLNVDWYLGDYVVDRVSLAAIDTAATDITISENSGTPASTVFVWSGAGWSSGATSQTTGTGADGKIPQPGTNGAIKIREYARASTGFTYYKYNLYITWQGATYGEYDYYKGYGQNYITSTLNTGSGEDECISKLWQRTDIDAQNTPAQAIDDPPTNGTWYNGMISGLSFSVDDYTIEFPALTPGGSPTNIVNTLTVSTSASNGYVVYTWSSQAMTRSGGSETIADWGGTNANPTNWASGAGFGYKTSDSSLTGGTADRFTNDTFCGASGGNGCWAGFNHTNSYPVADRTAPSSQETNIITYRIAATATQIPGTYTTSIIYIVVPNY